MRPPPRLGDHLLDSGLVTAAQLRAAADAQSAQGGELGRHLVLAGALSTRELYSVLARQWRAPYVDLVAEPADPVLVAGMDPRELLDRGWTPWRNEPDALVVATSRPPGPALRREVMHVVGDAAAGRVRFRTTTPGDLWRSVATRHPWGLTGPLPAAVAADAAAVPMRLRALPLLVAVALAALLVLRPGAGLLALLVLAHLGLVAAAAVTVVLAVRGLRRRHRRSLDAYAEARERARRGLPASWREEVAEHRLPLYTVLVRVGAGQVERALGLVRSLDYPRSRLDVLLLVDAADAATVQLATTLDPPEHVRALVVPAGPSAAPATAEQAVRHGLAFARGTFVVSFEATDRPDAGQLRAAVDLLQRERVESRVEGRVPVAVAQAAPRLVAVEENLTSRLDALETARWLDLVVPGLAGSAAHLPLPGAAPTSVHAVAAVARRGLTPERPVAVLDSATARPAATHTSAWLRSRTSWTTRLLATAAGRERRPGALAALAALAASPVALLGYPLVLALAVACSLGLGDDLTALVPAPAVTTALVTFLVSGLVLVTAVGLTAARRHSWATAGYALLAPVTWLLDAVVAWRALARFVRGRTD